MPTNILSPTPTCDDPKTTTVEKCTLDTSGAKIKVQVSTNPGTGGSGGHIPNPEDLAAAVARNSELLREQLGLLLNHHQQNDTAPSEELANSLREMSDSVRSALDRLAGGVNKPHRP